MHLNILCEFIFPNNELLFILFPFSLKVSPKTVLNLFKSIFLFCFISSFLISSSIIFFLSSGISSSFSGIPSIKVDFIGIFIELLNENMAVFGSKIVLEVIPLSLSKSLFCLNFLIIFLIRRLSIESSYLLFSLFNSPNFEFNSTLISFDLLFLLFSFSLFLTFFFTFKVTGLDKS